MDQRWRSLGVVVFTAAMLGGAALRSAEAKILAQWVQLGPDGSSSVRAIADDACPSVIFDGIAVPMRVRSDPAQKFGGVKPAQFPVLGCEVAVPAGSFAAVLDGNPLPLARPNPQRIVIFGDSGCRLVSGAAAQACNDPNAWPFPKIARAAATARPDLVIHVGDYQYRETACPIGNMDCAGSPWGFGWDAWNADVFQPAAPLLAAAPWVMARGNHENCSRAGEGWFRFLDRLPMEPTCRDLTGMFVARLGDFGIFVMDSGTAADPQGDPSELAAILHQQFIDVLDRIPNNAWLITHRPFNAIFGESGGAQSNDLANKVLQLALGADMPAGVRMIVSGHVHAFQAVDFGGTRPSQLVVGTGGDTLNQMPPMSIAGTDVNGGKVVDFATHSGFGYMVWDRLDNIWVGTLFDVDGKAITHCRLADRSLNCGS
jgi:calcineurin-like phosphoesterase family protein